MGSRGVPWGPVGSHGVPWARTGDSGAFDLAEVDRIDECMEGLHSWEGAARELHVQARLELADVGGVVAPIGNEEESMHLPAYAKLG